MTLNMWDPWSEMAALQRDVQELFGQGAQGTRRSASAVPAMDALRDGAGLVLRFDLPGLRAEDVDVNVERGVLTVSGARGGEDEADGGEWLRRERPTGRFARSLALPDGVDPGGIEARVEHGVLELRVPQSPEQQARRVPVSGGGRPEAIDAASDAPAGT